MAKESICRNCFHSYVCEQFNENKDENNEKCHFFNDHYTPTADVAPRAEVERLQRILDSYALQYGTVKDQREVMDRIKRAIAMEIFNEIIPCLAYTRFVSPSEKESTLNYMYALRKKYTEDSTDGKRTDF